MIENVSFIVIAKNEEFAVDRCLHSLLSMHLNNCEVLAIDSESSDGTLDIMRRYANENQIMSVFRCSGNVNSAVARNIGLEHVSKKYVCFCDGDTVWRGDFIQQALNIMEGGEADAVTGNLQEEIYSSDYAEIIETKTRVSYPHRKSIYYCGGNFIMSKVVAGVVGRWDDRMVRNQDIDYTLRVSRYGRLIGIPECLGTHVTQRYAQRVWAFFKSGNLRFHGAVIRKNLDRPKVLTMLLLRKNRGFLPGYFFFILCIVAATQALTTPEPSLYLIAPPLGFLMADLMWGAFRKRKIVDRFLTHYCYPLSVIRGLLFGAGPEPMAFTVEKVM